MTLTMRHRLSGSLRQIPKLVARKLTYACVIILGVTVAVQLLFSLVPGGPALAILGPDASPEAIAQVNAELGVDDPIWMRYLRWITGALHGDLGTSYRTGQPVLDSIVERLPVTLELAILGTVAAIALSFPLALVCAHRPGKLVDRVVTGTTSALISIPGFLLGLALVYLFAIQLRLFPILGWVPITDDPVENLRFLVLPVAMLAATEAAEYTRVLRGDLLTTLSEDFITVARSTGLPSRTIMLRYALRPSTLTVLTLAGLNFGRLLGGTVIAETIFSLPGLGSLVLQGIGSRDLPLLQGIVIFIAVAFVVINILVDILYALVDPRVRS
ncbi:ABC transporter permease [Rhodococcus koreensis]